MKANLGEVKFEKWPHIVMAQQFTTEWIKRVLFPLSDRMERMLLAKSCNNLLFGKEMITLFTAESTRTRSSEEIAMCRLCGRVVFSAPRAKFSSAVGKGETLEDTIWALNETGVGADVLVVRNDKPDEKPIAELAEFSQIPIINAGDGAGKTSNIQLKPY